MGKIFHKGMKEEDKKEGLLKRLKNIEKNQNSNDNEKNKKTNDISKPSSDGSESSSARSESSKKTSIIEYELERSVYSPDVANILEPKNETQTSFEYLELKK